MFNRKTTLSLYCQRGTFPDICTFVYTQHTTNIQISQFQIETRLVEKEEREVPHLVWLFKITAPSCVCVKRERGT